MNAYSIRTLLLHQNKIQHETLSNSTCGREYISLELDDSAEELPQSFFVHMGNKKVRLMNNLDSYSDTDTRITKYKHSW